MADETPPLDEARLEQMRGYAEAIRTAKHAIEAVSSELVHASNYILTLVAEVDRSRAREAAAMAIVEAVKQRSWYTHSSTLGGSLQQYACCPFPECEQESLEGAAHIPHTPDCPVTKARTLLDQE